MKIVRSVLGIFLLAVSALSGCHEFTHDGSGIFGGSANSLRGTVQRNDPRYRQILFVMADKRQVTLNYTAQTRVEFQGRDYPVQNIQAGDYIEMRARDVTIAYPNADTIIVINQAGGGRVESIEGRVEVINARSGTFEMRDQNNRIVLVVLPASPSQAITDRFNRLRNGDGITVEGRFTTQTRFELTSFQ